MTPLVVDRMIWLLNVDGRSATVKAHRRMLDAVKNRHACTLSYVTCWNCCDCELYVRLLVDYTDRRVMSMNRGFVKNTRSTRAHSLAGYFELPRGDWKCRTGKQRSEQRVWKSDRTPSDLRPVLSFSSRAVWSVIFRSCISSEPGPPSLPWQPNADEITIKSYTLQRSFNETLKKRHWP